MSPSSAMHVAKSPRVQAAGICPSTGTSAGSTLASHEPLLLWSVQIEVASTTPALVQSQSFTIQHMGSASQNELNAL